MGIINKRSSIALLLFAAYWGAGCVVMAYSSGYRLDHRWSSARGFEPFRGCTKTRSMQNNNDGNFYRALSLSPIPTIPPNAPEIMHIARDCMNVPKLI